MTANITAAATRSHKTAVTLVSLALIALALLTGAVAGLMANHGAPASAATSPQVFTPIQGKASIGDTGQISISGSASIGDTGTAAR